MNGENQKTEQTQQIETNGPNVASPVMQGENTAPKIEYDQRTAMLLMDLKDAREDAAYYRELLAQQKNKELLDELKALDPSIRSIGQLGEEFEKLLEAGVSTAVAYCAVNAVKGGKAQPTMGEIKPEKSDRDDFFSFEDVSAMSKEQIKKNYDKVMRSAGRWKSEKKLKA